MPRLPPVRPAIASGLRRAAEKAPEILQKPLNGAAAKLEKAAEAGGEAAKKTTLLDYAKENKLKTALLLGGVGFGYYQAFKSGEASGAAGQLSAAQEEALKSLTSESQDPQQAGGANLGWNETALGGAPGFDASQIGAYGIDPNTLAALSAQGGGAASGGLPAGLDQGSLNGLVAGGPTGQLTGAAASTQATPSATAGAGFDPAGVQSLLGQGQ